VGHPQACAALRDAAERAGVIVLSGVRDVTVTPGEHPQIAVSRGDATEDFRPRLVVGADGRASSVRKACALELNETEARLMLAGLLLGEAASWPEETNCMTVEGDWFVLGFPRPGGLLRVYAAYSVAAKDRLTGQHKMDEF